MLPRNIIIAALATAAALGLLFQQQQQQRRPPPGPPRMAAFGAFEFTVHGRVQGVFYRKFTVAKAKALHLVGWCANSQRGGTVVGECQGKPEALAEMKVGLLGSVVCANKHTGAQHMAAGLADAPTLPGLDSCCRCAGVVVHRRQPTLTHRALRVQAGT